MKRKEEGKQASGQPNSPLLQVIQCDSSTRWKSPREMVFKLIIMEVSKSYHERKVHMMLLGHPLIYDRVKLAASNRSVRLSVSLGCGFGSVIGGMVGAGMDRVGPRAARPPARSPARVRVYLWFGHRLGRYTLVKPTDVGRERGREGGSGGWAAEAADKCRRRRKYHVPCYFVTNDHSCYIH